MSLPLSIAAYLDTCIVSGLAKGDLAEEDKIALMKLLEERKCGRINLVTSSVVKEEIDRIPEQYRVRHEIIYNLLYDVPVAETHRVDSGLLLMGVGWGIREDPLLSSLKDILPDESDAHHIFQAAKNGLKYFLTTDRRTILHFATSVESICAVKPINPREMINLLQL